MEHSTNRRHVGKQSGGTRVRRRPAGTVWAALAVIAALVGPVWPAKAAVAAPLVQPTSASIANALDMAALNALPAGYPRLANVALIPPTLLKAVAWAESNWRQFRAPDHPLTTPDWGRGIMQVTRGMGGMPVDDTTQSAIINNYVYNIACGARVLAGKWATTPTIGRHDPAVLEDWYYALWAYNGWGWVNNPLNPRFTRQGTPLTDPLTYPYQERVIYLMAHPPADAIGRPLWTPLQVTLPTAKAIGRRPGALPDPSTTHRTNRPALYALALPGGDSAAVVADLTRPEDMPQGAGTTVHKEWLVRNTGGHFWHGYRLVQVAGTPAALTPTVALPDTPPLADIPVGVDVVMPAQGAGDTTWQVETAQGTPIGAPITLHLAVQ